MRKFSIVAPLFLALVVTAPSWGANKPASMQQTDQAPNADDAKQQWADAQGILTKASAAVGRFRSDPKMIALMRQAKGIFVIPEFGHGTSVPTGAWGSGLLMANNSGHWSNAAFFTLGGGSLGPHVIANGGSLLLFIMNDRAMAKFQNGSRSLSPVPGTNIVSYSAATPQDLAGQGADIVAWSASGGPNSDLEININGISADATSNGTVYGTHPRRPRQLPPRKIDRRATLNPAPPQATSRVPLKART